MGPYDTERETWTEPMPLAVRALHDAGKVKSGDPDAMVRGKKIYALFLALEDAGVETGQYDNQILAWLCEWEDSTVQVVIGLISRAYEAGRKADRYVDTPLVAKSHLWPCGCLINDAGAHRVGCPQYPAGRR